MKTKLLLVTALSSMIAYPAFADKPDWAGQGKPSAEQREARGSSGESKGYRKKGFEEQSEKKASQERKESGKGSEKGISSREEHSRKWWKFWE